MGARPSHGCSRRFNPCRAHRLFNNLDGNDAGFYEKYGKQGISLSRHYLCFVQSDLPADALELCDEIRDLLEDRSLFGEVGRVEWAHLRQDVV